MKNSDNMALYAEKKFSEQEIRMGAKLIKAMSEDEPDMLKELIESLQEAKENFNSNVDALLGALA